MEATTERKRCPQCGYANRMMANVCANCGYRFSEGLRKYCTRCGKPNRVRARVCIQCGKPFRPAGVPKWCPQCGKRRRPGAKVCSQCGYRFRTPASEPPIAPNPEPPLVLPPQFDLSELNPLPPHKPAAADVESRSSDLSGEPAPFISNEELNQLRGAGIYKRSVIARTMSRLNKKDKP